MMRAFVSLFRTIVCAVFLIGASVSPLLAQSYPTRPIRLVLPFPPGGTTDLLGRIIGEKLTERLGQPVVCENRPGAGGNIGIEFVAKARPDGYAIVLASPTPAISPSLYKKLNYDPIKDLAPISLVAQVPNVLIVRPSLPVKNLKDFVEYARANPGKLNFGTSGTGTALTLAGFLFKSVAKINALMVPYKGLPLAMIALMTGEIDVVVSTTAVATPQIQAGKVHPIAVLTNERLPSLPNVPTAKEGGIENLEVTTWYGMLAPAGTPRDIVNRLNQEWVKIAVMPDTVGKLQKAGFEPLSSTPEQFSEFIKAETVRWAKVIKENNISSVD